MNSEAVPSTKHAERRPRALRPVAVATVAVGRGRNSELLAGAQDVGHSVAEVGLQTRHEG